MRSATWQVLYTMGTGNAFGAKILEKLSEYESKLDEANAAAFRGAAEAVYAFGHRYRTGMLDYSTRIIDDALKRFLAVEVRRPSNWPMQYTNTL